MTAPAKKPTTDADALRKLVRESLDSFHLEAVHPLVRDAIYTNFPRLFLACGPTGKLVAKLWAEETAK